MIFRFPSWPETWTLAPTKKKPLRWGLKAFMVFWINGLPHAVAPGFVTDFTSTLWKNPGLWELAAVWHDWVYSVGTELKGWTRKRADAVYREMLIALGCDPRIAWVRYYALRAWGWIPWNRHARAIRREPERTKRLRLVYAAQAEEARLLEAA